MFAHVIVKRPANVPNLKAWLTSDGVHMSPAGDALMAIGVLRALGVPDDTILIPLGKASAKPATTKAIFLP